MIESFAKDFLNSEFVEIDGFELPKDFSVRFDVLECLASNALGDTYLLSEKDGGKRFVLKCYPKSLVDNANSEADLLLGLSHNGLPKLETKSENETSIFVLREYVEGIPLDHYMAERVILDKAQAVHIVTELCDVLSYLHSQTPPIIHRDIKPSNIVYDPDSGKVTLIDFGISRRYSNESDNDTLNLGTKKFAPPEQYGFAQTDCRTDIYALGILLRFLVTGDVDGTANDKILEQIIGKCCAFSPKDRYQSVNAVKIALIRNNPGTGRKKLYIAASVLALCLVIAAGLLASRYIIPSETPGENIGGGSFSENPHMFSNPFMEAAVRATLGKGETESVFLSELDRVEVLGFAWDTVVASRDEFQDISQAVFFGEDRRFGTLDNIDDVRFMPNLREIYIGGQPLSDLSPLEFCPRLTNITLNRCPAVTDITPLAASYEIWEFGIYDTGVSDISPLTRLPHISVFGLSGVMIRDLSPLKEMTALGYVLLFDMPLSSPADFGDAGSINTLIIRGTQFESLDGIDRLVSLSVLDIAWTEVRDFSPLAEHPALTELRINSDMEQYLDTLGRNDVHVTVMD